ncbi:somatostatin 1, tandem duplicate 1 [Trematomus bernacchii]|uniref:somatostatin 1, tandem duplicate 1 n=1 Tax=Trematomus bernacchii TaxID=40690 RepID=UPI00146E3BCD|nr:somatostatin 1, tandem duplicate 1 [Trematomus bernacchii]
MMKMASSSSHLLLLLSLSASLCCCSATQRDSKLLLLHRSPLKQELSRASLAELLLSDLLQENEALEEDGFPAAGEPENIRLDLERAAAAGPLLTPRERKAGCKNFFWKTFTSC